MKTGGGVLSSAVDLQWLNIYKLGICALKSQHIFSKYELSVQVGNDQTTHLHENKRKHWLIWDPDVLQGWRRGNCTNTTALPLPITTVQTCFTAASSTNLYFILKSIYPNYSVIKTQAKKRNLILHNEDFSIIYTAKYNLDVTITESDS